MESSSNITGPFFKALLDLAQLPEDEKNKLINDLRSDIQDQATSTIYTKLSRVETQATLRKEMLRDAEEQEDMLNWRREAIQAGRD